MAADPKTGQTDTKNAPEDDPERSTATVVRGRPRTPPPSAEARRRVGRPSKERASAHPSGAADDGSGEAASLDYDTGASYAAVDSGQVMSLEGDGLDPMDPEMVPRAPPADAAGESDSDADDEGTGEGSRTRAGQSLRLEITAGPDQGHIKRFRGVRLVIGRTPGVDLQLTDQSVSRRHVELVRSDQGVLLRDLGSGNGTRVNGEKVAEQMLKHDDVIALGKTKLRFVDDLAAFKAAQERAEKEREEAEAAAKMEEAEQARLAEEQARLAQEADAGAGEGAEEDGPGGVAQGPTRGTGTGTGTGLPTRRRPWSGLLTRFLALPRPVRLLVLAAAASPLVLGAVWLLRPPAPAPVDPNELASEQRLEAARSALREAAATPELDVALAKFEEVLTATSEAEQFVAGSDRAKLGPQARDALTYLRALKEAQALMASGRLEDAVLVLGRITPIPRLEDHKKRVEKELVEYQVKAKRRRVDELLGAGELEAAKALLHELPPEARLEPAAEIAEFEAQLQAQHERDARHEAARQAQAALRAQEAREEEVALAFAVVNRKLAGGAWERAASECTRVVEDHAGDREITARARQLASLIPSFGRTYDEGVKKYRQGQLVAAVRPLREARNLYHQINLKQNGYGEELAAKLEEALVSAGREALVRGDLGSAGASFREASGVEPGSVRARQGMDEVMARADDLYQAALAIKDRDPRGALRKFQMVVEATPSVSTLHQLAKGHVAALSP